MYYLGYIDYFMKFQIIVKLDENFNWELPVTT